MFTKLIRNITEIRDIEKVQCKIEISPKFNTILESNLNNEVNDELITFMIEMTM